MEDFIDRLRERPLHHRKAVSIAGASVVTGILGLAWAVTLFNGGGPVLNPGNDGSQAAAAAAAEGLEVKETQLEALRAQYGVGAQNPYQNTSPYQASPEPELQYQDPNRTTQSAPAYDANASLWYSPAASQNGL